MTAFDPQTIITDTIQQSMDVKQRFFDAYSQEIETCARNICDAMKQNKKLMLFGNGGSAADSQHIAAEFINRFQMERRPLPALALTTDTSVITSIGNDYSYDDIFLKQVQALGQKGDIAIGISTSGNSPNVVSAIKAARKMGIYTIGLSGKGGQLKELSDKAFCVDCDVTARIQEVHILLAHILCDLSERMIFDAG